MARLLVLACSATKRSDPDPIPALARYDGPLWRTLRAADPAGRRARVAFLSAHYGFRDAATPIAAYDARLTQDLAERMVADGVTTRWPRPPSPRRPDTYGMHAGAEIASVTGYGAEPFEGVAMVGVGLTFRVVALRFSNEGGADPLAGPGPSASVRRSRVRSPDRRAGRSRRPLSPRTDPG
ncbi:hypothetical protein MKK50_00925, partial [Methylobacterium sp. J-043]|nr:hypothetical protein [Methylobacterium sp. J-043]